MRKAQVIGILIIGALVSLYLIWSNLPITINRFAEIKLGNQVIDSVDNYLIKNSRVPNWNDWEALKKLGIQFNYESSKPMYQNLNDSIYELYFIEGFDGPYLMWNSIERKWKKGFPTYDQK